MNGENQQKPRDASFFLDWENHERVRKGKRKREKEFQSFLCCSNFVRLFSSSFLQLPASWLPQASQVRHRESPAVPPSFSCTVIVCLLFVNVRGCECL